MFLYFFFEMLIYDKYWCHPPQEVGSCQLDRHWMPLVSRCAYCQVPYTVVAKVETLAEDLKFIGKLTSVNFQPVGRFVCREDDSLDAKATCLVVAQSI